MLLHYLLTSWLLGPYIFLGDPQPIFLPQYYGPSFTPIRKKRKNCNFVHFNLYIFEWLKTKILHRLIAVILWLQSSLNLFTNAVLICWGFPKIFALFHPFRGFNTYIYVVILSYMLFTYSINKNSVNNDIYSIFVPNVSASTVNGMRIYYERVSKCLSVLMSYNFISKAFFTYAWIISRLGLIFVLWYL